MSTENPKKPTKPLTEEQKRKNRERKSREIERLVREDIRRFGSRSCVEEI
jgi:hypothetical protein